MKLSELIPALQKVLDKHGDMDVTAWPYDGHWQPFPAHAHVSRDASGPLSLEITANDYRDIDGIEAIF